MADRLNRINDRLFDVVVLGAGPGGEDVTTALLDAGLSVALVEPELFGGECFNWACVPSKAMLRPGHAVRSARRLPGAREIVGDALDAHAALAHRDHVVLHHNDASVVSAFEEAGAVFLRGRGRLDGRRRVIVDTASGEVSLGARQAVIIATGSTVAIPPIPGLAETAPWTTREATSAHHAPARLAVLGSGPAGLELAQAWRSLGSERVVVLARRDSLLPDMEPFVGDLVRDGLYESGVEVRFGVQAARVSRSSGHGEVVLDFTDGTTLVVDELLVATGKKPTTQGLGLETVHIAASGFLEVDDHMTVGGTDWLYAIGDVNGRALLTHEASYHARVAAAVIAARSRGEQPTMSAVADAHNMPQVIFTDPEVAAVGLTQHTAAENGMRVRYVEVDLGAVLGAQLHAKDFTGRASLLIDQDTDVIVGAAFVGQDVADMLQAATVAIVGQVPLHRLQHAVPSFPTMSEVWLDLLKGRPAAS